jgi:hypothetical protein
MTMQPFGQRMMPVTGMHVPAADNGADFPWWIVLAAVAVLGIGAIVVVAIKKKKG